MKGARAGFTLLEVMVALSIASILAVGVSMAAKESYDAYRTTTVSSSTESRLRNAIQRARRELMGSGVSVLFPANIDDDFGTSDLAFQTPVGVNVATAEPLWGPTNRLVLEYEQGEVDDGVDNDGDGLVDEGVLVLIRDDGGPNEQRVILCRDVRELAEGETINNADDNGNDVRDEAGFNVHREGNVLTLRLTLEEVEEQAGTVVRSMFTTVRLRN